MDGRVLEVSGGEVEKNLPRLPTIRERSLFSPYRYARLVVDAYEATISEMRTEGLRRNLGEATRRLRERSEGRTATTASTYHYAKALVDAVELFGFDPHSTQLEAVLFLREKRKAGQQMLPQQVERALNDAVDIDPDPKTAMETAVRALLAAHHLTKFKPEMLGGYIATTLKSGRRTDTKKTARQLLEWLTRLNETL